jgi:hypothetical protein
VFFDCVGSTSTNVTSGEEFGEMGFHFDFGYATPSTPGTWPISGEPKGEEIGGALAGHVYETPGTYTASVRVQDATGLYKDVYITVVVVDPSV